MIHSTISIFRIMTNATARILAVVSVFLVLGCSYATAQSRVSPRRLDFGVIGGANISSYAFYPKLTQDQTYGYTAGVAVRYVEETFFGLQAELLLTQRGFKDALNEDLQELGYSYQRKLTYLEVPIMAHIYFRMGRRNQICLDAGPKLGFFMSDKIESNMPEGFDQGIYKDPVTGYMRDMTSENYKYLHHTMPIEKKFDYGIQFGLGYEFRFSKEISAQLMGRYYYGLGNLWADKKTDVYEASSNNSIQVTLTLWYHTFIKGKKKKVID